MSGVVIDAIPHAIILVAMHIAHMRRLPRGSLWRVPGQTKYRRLDATDESIQMRSFKCIPDHAVHVLVLAWAQGSKSNVSKGADSGRRLKLGRR